MNEYIGKKCPYCATEFVEGDDIVICSVCDMPHHKDCWISNQGCSTFGCLGTAKNPDGSPSSVTASTMNFDEPQQAYQSSTLYCPICGTPNTSAALFCSKCGTSLQSQQRTQPTSPNYATSNQENAGNPYAYSNPGNAGNPYGYSNQTYQQQNNPYFGQNNYSGNQYNDSVYQFIGKKSDYYIQKFTKMKTIRSKLSWNWSAFLFTPLWFIFRKMYIIGGIMFLLLPGVSALTVFYPPLSVLNLAVCVASGLFGNYIYYCDLEKRAIQSNLMNEPFRTQFILKKTGTSNIPFVLAAIFTIIVTIYLFFADPF